MRVLLADSPLALVECPEDIGPMLRAEELRLTEILAEADGMPEADYVRRRLERIRQALAVWQHAEGQLSAAADQIRTAAVQRIGQVLGAG